MLLRSKILKIWAEQICCKNRNIYSVYVVSIRIPGIGGSLLLVVLSRLQLATTEKEDRGVNQRLLLTPTVKFIYSEKATKFCEIFPLLLTVCTVVKS